MAPPPELIELVGRFRRNIEDYRSGRYNETQVRREFVDPFFKLLGWDVDNERGSGERYKDVVHEDRVIVGGGMKAPDYCFRLGGARKFFVETKKPSEDIKHQKDHAYQLRRYAWSARLPVSVLTDFEELAVYDCRTRPTPRDGAAKYRVLYLDYEKYADEWDRIEGILSKKAVDRGDFDRFVERDLPKRGTAEVDGEFLKDIERWREALAKDVASRNPRLSQREVNSCVQRTIDRIIFLRIAEDRGVEGYGRLLAETNGSGVYKRLFRLFRDADVRYNSGLFHFEAEPGRATAPDELTPAISVDDGVVRDIIAGLYYPESPYQFDQVPTEILGQVYEQFLGKVIRLTAGHSAKVEEKPEVRKAGGVYYTPAYIVDYIVKNTVGRLLEKAKTPKAAEKLKILDPACGSGSFLLGAYQALLDWHLDFYTKHSPEKWAKGRSARMFRGKGDAWHLTVAERKRVLLANVFGVDIDEQAVEVTKLSLLLKVLEGAAARVQDPRSLFARERALPDLGANVKCGNSLIGPDYWEERRAGQMSLLKGERKAPGADEPDDEERLRVNAFDWKTEFADVFSGANPGFDAVIGNPPYLFVTEMEGWAKQYYRARYDTYSFRYDVYGLFIEIAMARLLAPAGLLGFIIPHTLLNNDSFLLLRKFLLAGHQVVSVVDLGPGVFRSAKNETMIIMARRSPPGTTSLCNVVKAAPDLSAVESSYDVPQATFLDNRSASIVVGCAPKSLSLLKKLRTDGLPLEAFCVANQGLRTGDNDRLISSQKRLASHKPGIGGRDVDRYVPPKCAFYVQYEPQKLDRPREEWMFTAPTKIVVQEIRNITLPRRLVATLDTSSLYCIQSTNVINNRPGVARTTDLRYILGMLNSGLLNWFFRLSFPSNNHIATNQLSQLPITPPTDTSRHDRMVSLVQRMLDLNRRAGDMKPGHERTVIEREIAATDRSIDELVYELYGLSDKEVKIVEEATGKGPDRG